MPQTKYCKHLITKYIILWVLHPITYSLHRHGNQQKYAKGLKTIEDEVFTISVMFPIKIVYHDKEFISFVIEQIMAHKHNYKGKVGG